MSFIDHLEQLRWHIVRAVIAVLVGAIVIFIYSGNVRITFESWRVSHTASPGPVNRVVIGRLVMPIDAAEALARSVLDFISQQRTAQNPPTQTATGTVH